MAAEILAKGGIYVTLVDHMPTPARKFLLAGRGGLNPPLGTLGKLPRPLRRSPRKTRTRRPRLPAGRPHRLGHRPRHRDLHRLLGPRVPKADESLAATARLAPAFASLGVTRNPANGRASTAHPPSSPWAARPGRISAAMPAGCRSLTQREYRSIPSSPPTAASS